MMSNELLKLIINLNKNINRMNIIIKNYKKFKKKNLKKNSMIKRKNIL